MALGVAKIEYTITAAPSSPGGVPPVVTKLAIKQAINPASLGLVFRRVSESRGAVKVEIIAGDPEKEIKFKESLKRAGYLCSDSAHYRLPRVVVSGVEGHMTEDDVLLALRSQNSVTVAASAVTIVRSFESKGRPGLKKLGPGVFPGGQEGVIGVEGVLHRLGEVTRHGLCEVDPVLPMLLNRALGR